MKKIQIILVNALKLSKSKDTREVQCTGGRSSLLVSPVLLSVVTTYFSEVFQVQLLIGSNPAKVVLHSEVFGLI